MPPARPGWTRFARRWPGLARDRRWNRAALAPVRVLLPPAGRIDTADQRPGYGGPMARYGGLMASSRTALSQLVSPDRRLAWSLTAAARRREWERARVLRSWQAAQRAQQRTARRSARAAPRSAVLGATFLAMAVPAGGSTRAVCALASLRSARQRAGGPPVPALPPPLPLPPPVQSAAFPAVRRLHRRGE